MQYTDVDVLGEKYRIVRAPAVQQKKLFFLLASVLGSADLSKAVELDNNVLAGVISANENRYDQISEIVLYKTVCLSNPEKIVEVEDFQNKIFALILLTVEGIKYNLSDFLGYVKDRKS